MHPAQRIRRLAIMSAAAFGGLLLTAGPAAANPINSVIITGNTTAVVTVNNGSTDPLLVKAAPGPGIHLTVRTGCEVTPPVDAVLAACLPAGGVLAFAVKI